MTEEKNSKGLDLPEHVRRSLASIVAQRGVQARIISTQGRESMRPPQGHLVVAATRDEIDNIRGRARVVRQLEFYKTPYGPVVRLAFSIYPENGAPLSADTLLNVSQVSGEAALSGLGRQKSLYVHFYYTTDDGDLAYGFSKELTNAPEQRAEAKKILKMAREAYSETPQDRRSFRRAVSLAQSRFEPPVPNGSEHR